MFEGLFQPMHLLLIVGIVLLGNHDSQPCADPTRAPTRAHAKAFRPRAYRRP